MNDLPFALRVLAGRDPGVEYLLEDYDREILVGRSEDLDIVLDDARVSRKHCRIFVDQERLFIEDLGSTNGIYVNAQRVWLAALKEGDRVQIGTSLFKLVPAPAVARENSSLEQTDLIFPPEYEDDGEVTVLTADSSNRFSGSLTEIPLLDLVQLLSSSKKSGVLRVETKQGAGNVFLREGRIVYAAIDQIDSLRPQKAVYRMLMWTSGRFEFRPPEEESFPTEIQEAAEGLLMEAMRQIDELARIEKYLPPRELRLSLADPPPPMRKLNSDQLEVLKLMHNTPEVSVGTILDTCPLPDLEIYLALIHLARSQYLTVAK